MEYKPTFTKEEIDELVEWFNTHKYEQAVDLGNGISTANLVETLKPMIRIAQTKYDNRTFSGQIHVLFQIRDTLIRQGKVLD